MNEIFDSHAHINIDRNFSNAMLNFQNSMHENQISKSLIFIDPFAKEFDCENGKNHYVCVKNHQNEELQTFCTKCEEQVYHGNDPYICYNNVLLNSINDENVFPFVTLSVSGNTMSKTIKYYEEFYKYRFFGFKIYTGLSSIKLDSIEQINSDLPVIIHTGFQPNQNPKYMFEFLRKYNGPIVLAHFARFEPNTIKLINSMDNIYIDTSPAFYLYNRYILNKHEGGLLDRTGLDSPESFYYRILDMVGADKVIFGTDYPFSDRKTEIGVLKNLKLSVSEYEKITHENIQRILRR